MTGVEGQKGAQGDRGTSHSDKLQNNDKCNDQLGGGKVTPYYFIFFYLNFTLTGIKGQKGQQGDPGQGPPGQDGPQGPRGKMHLNAISSSSSI